IFYSALGAVPGRGSFVSGMEIAMTVDAALLALATAVTLLLTRRPAPATVPAPAPAGQTAQASEIALHADVAG
ncbi:MAG TPA: hypothetical protein VMC03_14115, partial [Streptosporangiaceae bacterium]|nr:hypothetical protein [Streptosporangiaceae bacterium]